MQLIFTSGTKEEMKCSEEKFLEDDEHVTALVRDTCSSIKRKSKKSKCCLLYYVHVRQSLLISVVAVLACI